MSDLFTTVLLVSVGISATLQCISIPSKVDVIATRKTSLVLNLVLAIIASFKIDPPQVASFVAASIGPMFLNAVLTRFISFLQPAHVDTDRTNKQL